MKALIMLDRIDEAIEFYETLSYYDDHDIDDLLFYAGKYREVRDYYLKENEFKSIDKLKISIHKKDPQAICELGDYYISWIDKIKYKYDVKICPDCGGELIPILWGYPDNSDLEKSAKGELHLGGCSVIVPFDYYCKKCTHEFNLGYKGLHIECDDDMLYEYISFKIEEITDELKIRSRVFIKSPDTVKNELIYFDDKEFKDLINHLLEIGYICEPKKGYIKLVDFDNYKTAKEYLDDGKFAAPRWLVYPQLSAWTIGWRMGYGEDYAMNHPHHSREYCELFPMPKYWEFNISESQYKPHPPIGYFWSKDGKPKYPKASGGLEVNDFITLDDEKEFRSDTFRFKSIAHAQMLSKALYFGRDPEDEDFKFSPMEEKTWEVYRYSVLLNAAYFKIMADDELTQKLLETGDEPLIYISDDSENLFGRALMEIRDEIRRICKNVDLIDWEYSEYLKYKRWW